VTAVFPADVLREARAVVAKGWCKHAFAVDSEEDVVPSMHPRACRRDVMGALNVATQTLRRGGGSGVLMASSIAHALLVLALRQRQSAGRDGEGVLAHFNDDPATKVEDVLELFDRVIAEEVAPCAG
jgi:hypothetical protein